MPVTDLFLLAAAPGPVADATHLIAQHGADAAAAAERLAVESRDRGNAIRFCRWRAVSRLCALIASTEVSGTIH